MNGLRRIGSLLVCALAAGVFAAGAFAQENRPLTIAEQLGLPGLGGGGGEVLFSGSFTVQEGTRKGTVSLTASIQEGWHVYSVTQPKGATMPSTIKLADEKSAKVLGPFQPDKPPHVKKLEIYRVPVEEHTGDVKWSAPIELAEGVDPATLTLELQYEGQVCSDEAGQCIPISNTVAAKFAGYTKAAATPGEYRPDPARAEVVFKGHLEPAAVTPGGTVKLTITAEPNEGWHVYAYQATDPGAVGTKPTLIVLQKPPGWKQTAITASAEPIVKPAHDKLPEARYHEERVSWTTELIVPADAEQGEHILTGYIGFLTCLETRCLRPEAVQIRIPITVAAHAVEGTAPVEFIDEVKGGYTAVAKLAAAEAEANQPASGSVAAQPFTLSGFLTAAILGLLGGLILNLMPCVLPVIGIKVMSFAQQGGQSRSKVLALNIAFTLGILAVFLALATAAVFFGQNWGEQFTYTWFKVSMVVLVFAFALSFLGVWEVPIPGFAMSSASSNLQKQEGTSGAFFKGIFTTLLATPCSGPLLGPLFLFALNQSAIVAYTIFLCIGLGLAAPYLVIGTFPALARWLPKPGEWMETVKQLMGFVLLLTVVYLIWSVDTGYFVATFGLLIAVWFGLWIVGRVPVYEELPKQAKAWAGGLAAAALIGYLSFSFFGPVDESRNETHLAWQPYTEQSLAQAQSEGKTVMLDFTANWCLTCQWNSKFAIDTANVKSLVEKNGVVPMLADWTNQNDEIKAKLTELNSRSIPLLAIYPAGRPNEVIVLRDTVLESQVIEALEKAGPSNGGAESAGATAAETAMAPPAG